MFLCTHFNNNTLSKRELLILQFLIFKSIRRKPIQTYSNHFAKLSIECESIECTEASELYKLLCFGEPFFFLSLWASRFKSVRMRLDYRTYISYTYRDSIVVFRFFLRIQNSKFELHIDFWRCDCSFCLSFVIIVCLWFSIYLRRFHHKEDNFIK